VEGLTVSDIEAEANRQKAVRIQFQWGEVWRKIAGEWVCVN
jgi:hypothetical protein